MKNHFNIDLWLMCPVVILVLIGLATLASINPIYFRNQSIYLVIAIIIFFIVSLVNFNALRNLKIPIYTGSLILLTIILLIGIESRGAMRWIEIFGIRVQFSEILKPTLSLAIASFIADKQTYSFKTFLFLIMLLAPVVILIYLQPDLGNALIYAIAFFLVLITVGFPIIWFSLSILPAILISPFLWTMLHEYQRQRIITFIYPQGDPLGTSYNSIQALIAIGSGMFLGKGLGESTQSGLKFLPEKHTDFIFASLSEGTGFIGSLIVVTAMSILLYRIYKIFINTDQLFERTLLACCFFFLSLQFLLNIGMNIGILPVVGVTLPFLSFGGSSLISNFIFLAIASSISFSLKNKNVLEIK